MDQGLRVGTACRIRQLPQPIHRYRNRRHQVEDPRRSLPPACTGRICRAQHPRDRPRRRRQSCADQLPLPNQGSPGHRRAGRGEPAPARAAAADVRGTGRFRAEVGAGATVLHRRSRLRLRARAGRVMGGEPFERRSAQEVPAAHPGMEAGGPRSGARCGADAAGAWGRVARAVQRRGHCHLDHRILARHGVRRPARCARGAASAPGGARRHAAPARDRRRADSQCQCRRTAPQ